MKRRKVVDLELLAQEERIVGGPELDLLTNTRDAWRREEERKGRFPLRVSLTDNGRGCGHLLSEVRAWIKERAEKSRAPDAPSRSRLAGPGRPKKEQAEKRPRGRPKKAERRAA